MERFFLRHFWQIRPSNDRAWQTKQLALLKTGICAKHSGQIKIPSCPQPRHFLGKRISRKKLYILFKIIFVHGHRKANILTIIYY